jgi:hypothetical protein
MVSGPMGMWYRAARYDTKEEALEFINRVKPMLRTREDPTDNILTVTFGTPENAVYAVVLGYPTPATIAYVEKLFERPAIVLSQEELHFATLAVKNMRRDAGVGDQEASAWARQRLQGLGAPDDLVAQVAQDFAGEPGRSFDAVAGSGSPALPGLQPGTPLKITPIPFIIGYRDLQARGIASTPDKYHVQRSAGTDTLQDTMNTIIARKLKRADKYQFDASAIAMLDTVIDTHAQDWLHLQNNLWVEFAQALNTAHGADIRALWVHSMDLQGDIKEVAPPGQEIQVYRLMMERNALYKDFWSFNIITARCKEMFDFTYDMAGGRFVYLYSHVCPYGDCGYPIPETRYTLGECSPCLQCQSALAYWASLLHTSIRIIRREFALAPQEPRPYPLAPETYTETVNTRVGKGKNARHIRQEKRREIDYRLVSFEVSELGYPARALGDEIIEQEERAAQEKGKRANWLTLAQAGAPDTIIWEYREIDTSKGRTLDPGHNPRWKEYKHLEIAPFKKWIPMLSRDRKVIRRVTARRYTAQDGK